jgi:hypothetical protein
MPPSGAAARAAFLPVSVIPMPEPWEAVLVPVPGFPVPAQELAMTRSFLRRLSNELMKPRELSLEVFIQFNQLHLEDGATRLANHARVWKPQHGLGVFPDRQPPTLWTREDFENPPGGIPPPMMHKVFRVSGSRGTKEKASDVMLGLGTVVQVLTVDPGDLFLSRAKRLLLPPIRERALRSFPMYMPLLECKSLAGAEAGQLQDWFCGASVYMRESAEDKGVLIASRNRLGPILQILGGTLDVSAEPQWKIPC